MKLKVVSFAVATLFGLVAAQSVYAQSIDQGHVKFTGELNDNTCTIDAGRKDQIVPLPKVYT
ncbi:type 1 fimbrial protein, partial [Burkholderia pseudomallei]